MVNFPIALLAAAAVAELLLMATHRAVFEAAGRFCLVFGASAAVVAAALGWCFAGFRLADEDWLLTTHRWLGTSTAAWSGLLLWIGSGTAREGTRTVYRAVLFAGATLVMATGFFGGAMLYGLDHHLWPTGP
jgi:uncharacterized membrane protein